MVAGNVIDAEAGLAREGEGHHYVANRVGGRVSDGFGEEKVQLPVSLYLSEPPDSVAVAVSLESESVAE